MNAKIFSVNLTLTPLIFCLLIMLSATGSHALTVVRFYTSFGTFDVQTYEDKVPAPSLNFINLVRNGYYDGMIFQRIIEGFVNQTGDPATNGQQEVPVIEDQYHDDLIHDRPGRISMAHIGPNTSTSHFAIQLDEQPHLDGSYAVFAQVIDGMDVVIEMNQVATDGQDKPIEDVNLDSIRVISDNIPYESEGATARFYTNWGEWDVKVYEDLVPITGNNFLNLVASGFYDGMYIHRVAKDWVIQMGDPATNGKEEVENIPEEILPELRHTHGGIISMASNIQAGFPGTGNSQFAIQLGPSPSNDDLFTIFSEVIMGMEFVWAIGGVEVDGSERPLEDVTLDSIRILEQITGVAWSEQDKSAYIFSRGKILFIPSPADIEGVQIFTMQGRKINSLLSMTTQSENFLTLDFSSLPQGIYHYKIRPKMGSSIISGTLITSGN